MNDEQITIYGLVADAWQDEPENQPRWSISDLKDYLSMPDPVGFIQRLLKNYETESEVEQGVKK